MARALTAFGPVSGGRTDRPLTALLHPARAARSHTVQIRLFIRSPPTAVAFGVPPPEFFELTGPGEGLDAAAEGDLAAAKALIPYFDQALGKPTEHVEHKHPSSIDELEQMSDEELERLVAEGRQQRLQGLQAVPDASDWRRRDPSLGVVSSRRR